MDNSNFMNIFSEIFGTNNFSNVSQNHYEDNNINDEGDYEDDYDVDCGEDYINYKKKYEELLDDYNKMKNRYSEKESKISRNTFIECIKDFIYPIYNDIKLGADNGNDGNKIILKKIKKLLKDRDVLVVDDSFRGLFDEKYMTAIAVHNSCDLINHVHKVYTDGMIDLKNGNPIIYANVCVIKKEV